MTHVAFRLRLWCRKKEDMVWVYCLAELLACGPHHSFLLGMVRLLLLRDPDPRQRTCRGNPGWVLLSAAL